MPSDPNVQAAQPLADKRWRRALEWLRQRMLVRIVAGAVFVVLPVTLVQKLALLLPLERSLTRLPATVIAAAAALGGYWLYCRWVERRAAPEIGRRGAAAELVAGLLLGAVLITLTVGLMMAFGVLSLDGWGGTDGLARAAAISIGAGVIEEILFRGVLFQVIESRWGAWWALGLTSVLFGAVHLGNPGATWFNSAAIGIEAGLLLGAAFMLTRRLWLAIGTHIAWNFTQGGVYGVAVSGVSVQGLLRSSAHGPDWLSGGSFGAEASVFALVVGVLAAGLLLWRAGKLNPNRGGGSGAGGRSTSASPGRRQCD